MSQSRLSIALKNLTELHSPSNTLEQKHTPVLPSPLTPEQQAVLDSPIGRHTIQAYAGCGKTFLLSQLAKKHHHKYKVLYLAFNQSIAQEASGIFGSWAKCQTTHSLALQWLQRSVKYKKLSEQLREYTVWDICKQMALNPKTKLPLAHAYLQTLHNFFSSSAVLISPEHIPAAFLLSESRQSIEPMDFVETAQRLWERIIDGHSTLGVSHDAYLKLWTLHHAPLDYDLLLLDEAQDSNAALTHNLSSSYLYATGDSHQSIYQFRGAVNALEQIENSQRHALTVTQRFGGDLLHLVNAFLFLKNGQERLSSAQEHGSFNAYGTPPSVQSMFVARTNLSIVKKALQCTAQSIPYYLAAPLYSMAQEKSTFSMLETLQSQKKYIDHPQYGVIHNIEQLEKLANIAQDTHLNFMIQLFKEYGARGLEKLDLITQKQTQNKHAICLTTVHKSKGLQAPWVEIADDFDLSIFKKNANPWRLEPTEQQEDNIFYVAITRAQQGIYFSSPSQYAWAHSIKSHLCAQTPIASPTSLEHAEQQRWELFFDPLASPS